jgi:hypothetical protein
MFCDLAKSEESITIEKEYFIIPVVFSGWKFISWIIGHV